ncbi:MAG: AraC family transcriptional regulator [Paenibacillus sp.]|jgi:AraC-like DNA-binding protein|nr:AraC family transcriptional regulator [Paenibacillus sp.]
MEKDAWFTVHYSDGWSNDLPVLEHKHDTYELDLFIKANIKIFVSDRQYDIRDGDLLLISPYDIHRMVYADGRYERYVVNFNKEPLERYYDSIGACSIFKVLEQSKERGSRKLEIPLKERPVWEGLFQSLILPQQEDESMDSVFVKQETGLTLALLLMKFFQRTHQVTDKTQKTGRKEQQVRSIIQFLDARYTEPVSLQLLEKAFHLNRYYISHIFKEITRFSIVEYLQYRRILEAQSLLRKTNKPVADICFDCGFTNIQHFHSVFKKITKSTPHQYRKSK